MGSRGWVGVKGGGGLRVCGVKGVSGWGQGMSGGQADGGVWGWWGSRGGIVMKTTQNCQVVGDPGWGQGGHGGLKGGWGSRSGGSLKR